MIRVISDEELEILIRFSYLASRYLLLELKYTNNQLALDFMKSLLIKNISLIQNAKQLTHKGDHNGIRHNTCG